MRRRGESQRFIVSQRPRQVAFAGLSDGPLAQLVEQLTLNQLVVGSIPTRPTNFTQKLFQKQQLK